jgi:aldose 1-epimerase
MAAHAGVAATPPSGEQFVIRHAGCEATITEVGATLRRYRVDGHDVLDGFGEQERATDGRGQVLAPWPNRIAEGRYTYGRHECQAPLNEVSRRTAIHGLVRWLDWSPVAREDASVSLACRIRPQPGYEWRVDLEVAYAVGERGLTVRLLARNTGDERAPFGAGFHPYLTLGAPVDGLELTVPATHYLDLSDPDLPPPAHAVDGEHDFTAPRRVGATRLDTAYGELVRGEDGLAVARLADPDSGRSVELWVDAEYPYLMIYTGDKVARPERRRAGIAIEPMTCPPDALRSGADLVELDPGESWSGSWGVR